jgi:hypothetical protein
MEVLAYVAANQVHELGHERRVHWRDRKRRIQLANRHMTPAVAAIGALAEHRLLPKGLHSNPGTTVFECPIFLRSLWWSHGTGRFLQLNILIIREIVWNWPF